MLTPMKVLGFIAVVGAILMVATAPAQATYWLPGSTYWVTAKQAKNFLEGSFDSASCRGLARYGQRGTKFRRFTCMVRLYSGTPDAFSCTSGYAAVKARYPGYFRLRLVNEGTCR
jgi:hypothetical protein